MEKKYAFLFPGQGAQEPGMMRDVCEAFGAAGKTIDMVSEAAGVDVKKLMWESDAAALSRSDNSQLAMTAASLAIAAVLREKGVEPSAAMGFSLGEFPALCAAGVLSFGDAVAAVRERGRVMQEVCDELSREGGGEPPGMSAIIGLAPEKVAEICDGIDGAYCANFNSPKQTVVSGTARALAAAEKAAADAGARRAARLAVAGPFHCPLMRKAADEFEKAIEGVEFRDPKIDLFSNVTGGRVASGAEAKKNAVLHLTSPVLWTREERALQDLMEAEGGAWRALEVGAGRVLAGLWKKSDGADKSPCLSVNSAQAVDDALAL